MRILVDADACPVVRIVECIAKEQRNALIQKKQLLATSRMYGNNGNNDNGVI